MGKAIQDGDTKTLRTHAKGPLATTKMGPGLLLQIIGTLLPPQEDCAAEQSQKTTWTVEWTDDWEVTEEELWEATTESGLRRRGAGPGRNPGPDQGGRDGGHGSQSSAPLHEISERGSLPPGMADGEAGLAA